MADLSTEQTSDEQVALFRICEATLDCRWSLPSA
jgi:hypothetical protein